MKTTIDIADGLLAQARQQAQEQGTTLRALVEQGLRSVLEDSARPHGFKLRKASFGGSGLRAEWVDASWDRIRELAYEGRGT
jgi:Arc/MetJ family transcription regulator